MSDHRPRVPAGGSSNASLAGGAPGLDVRAADLRALLRLGIPLIVAFGVGELAIGVAFRDAASLVGAAALFATAAWVMASIVPRIDRVPIDRLAQRLAVGISPAIILAGLPQPGAGTIAALIPVAVALPYLDFAQIRRVALLSLALATLIAASSDYFPISTSLPIGVMVALHVCGVVAAVGMVSHLVAQFARRLRSTTAELESVVAVSRDLAQTLDAHDVGDLTARAVALTVGADECAVSTWEPGADLIRTHGYFPPERRTAVSDSYRLEDYPTTRGVLEAGRALLISDDDPAADPIEVAFLRSIGQRSMLMVPLIANGRVVGIVEATSRRPRAFGGRQLELAGSLAIEAAFALENGRLYGEVRQRAFYDSLTGLANRELFRDRVAHALARRPAPNGPRIAVMFLDLDDFKVVNDTFGHAGGDELLTAVARRLLRCLRPADTAARLGGDEFAILLEDLPDEAPAALVAQRLIDALRPPVRLGTAAAVIGTSIGIAVASPGEASADDLLRDADSAMYRAKTQGKGRFEIFRPALRQAATERAALEARLAGAVERDELRLHYQPIVDLEDGRISGVEALLRWEVPGRGVLLPASFIGPAEESGAIVPIGRWVLDQACRQAAEWQSGPGPADLAVGVNLSARQFQHPDLVAEITTALGASGLDPSCLVLEITESILMTQTTVTIEKLADLRRLGVRLAVDDFGTGYSSLGYLERFPVDILKIDRTFVEGLGRPNSRPVLARAIVQLGRALSLNVVAEGIERPEQARALRRLGCPRGQGHLYARAITAEELLPILRRGRIATPGDRRARRPVPLRLAESARGIA